MLTSFDIHQYNLAPDDRRMLLDALEGLSREVQAFPVADLHILIEGNTRSNDVSVKLTLILSGKTLVTNDHDPTLSAAFDRCLSSLRHALEAYKARLGNDEERQKLEEGTLQPVRPTQHVDVQAIDQAVSDGDYAAFRSATLPFEDALQARAGRWVQRFPEYEARIGKDVKVSDVTEEIFLTAFDRYADRATGVPFTDWLISLIDPAVKELMTRTSDELENINLNRSALNATQPIPRG
jgi:ribosome-associated translation inhibitor RaiA